MGTKTQNLLNYGSKVDPTVVAGAYLLTEEPSASAVPVGKLKYKWGTLQTRQQRRREKMEKSSRSEGLGPFYSYLHLHLQYLRSGGEACMAHGVGMVQQSNCVDHVGRQFSTTISLDPSTSFV